ncbi:ATP-grasp domain-containing protein [Lutibacter agarilyticus]|uniref:ATP-grasp domain-containing protein n=1 Tax=Lutibacter agarilyticus TaxID=1109740 RepID=A0A238W5N0_9FLAO|nr:ATP-grasp domain-containing protein [Lutibacter agarilyticus]SNR41905.1 ATP-grasp domain-containing protein [Lutibacter agarilyticus]
MILIDKPFVSDFLIKTIKEFNFPVVATSTAKEMISDETIHWVSEEDAIQQYKENQNSPIYTNSENAINWIEKNLTFSELPSKIKRFKNKIKFRELIKNAYPNYFFKGVKYQDLQQLSFHDLQFPLIIKPTVGFFSLAVHKIDNWSEWKAILPIISKEITEFKAMYPKEVVDVTDFIIEEFIKGEEYAIDCYFNANGKVVILNIMHHTFSSEKDVSDRVYATSKKIITAYFSEIEQFLQLIGNKAQLKNFPMHVEVRINAEGNVIPIEVNPMRFGGWCTTGDISFYAFEFNSYQYFLESKTPNWTKIFDKIGNKKYNLIVLDNNSGISENAIESFNYDLLLKDFKKPLNLRKVDFRKYAVFGFVFTETTPENELEIQRILKSDLKKYILLKP